MNDKDLQIVLDAYLNRFATFAAPPRAIRAPQKRRMRLNLLAAVAVVAVVVAVLAIPIVLGRFQSRHATSAVPRQPTANVSPRPPLHHNGQIVMGVDNSLIAIDPATGHHYAILSAPAGDVVTSPVYSPDGTKLAYLRGRVVNSTGNYSGSPDAMDSIWVLDTTTGHDQQLTTCHRCSPYDYISWSPDGSRLAFSETDQRGSSQLHLINADGTHRTQLTHFMPGWNSTQPTWSPDGSLIAFTFFIVASDPSQGIVYPTVNIDVIRPDGTWLGGLPGLLDEPSGVGYGGIPYLEPAWSPDGSRIAYQPAPGPQGTGYPPAPGPLGKGVVFQLWLMAPDGSHQTSIFQFQYRNCCTKAWGGPTWSPDGMRVAVVTAGTLWVMGADGSAPMSLGVISGDRPAWQPVP
jgi:Tol biopolymer transport system component